jgi:hypothetical protein
MNLKQNLPVQVGFSVFQLAKLRMLEFYYDFLDKYFDRSDYQLLQMDTDSMYLGLSLSNLDLLVKPHLNDEYNKCKHLWFGREDTPENKLRDKREPGLFKLEFEGEGIVALSSKMYFCWGEKEKYSSKGLNRNQNEITKQRYLAALEDEESQIFKNKGFRVVGSTIATYTQEKTGMKLMNDKRQRNGFETTYLDI